MKRVPRRRVLRLATCILSFLPDSGLPGTAIAAAYIGGVLGLVIYQSSRPPGDVITSLTIVWIGVLSFLALPIGLALVRPRTSVQATAAETLEAAFVVAFAACVIAVPTSMVLASLVSGDGPLGCADECHQWGAFSFGVLLLVGPLGAALGGWLRSHSARQSVGAALVVGSLPWLAAVALVALAFIR